MQSSRKRKKHVFTLVRERQNATGACKYSAVKAIVEDPIGCEAD
jgi:hypothetical protein